MSDNNDFISRYLNDPENDTGATPPDSAPPWNRNTGDEPISSDQDPLRPSTGAHAAPPAAGDDVPWTPLGTGSRDAASPESGSHSAPPVSNSGGGWGMHTPPTGFPAQPQGRPMPTPPTGFPAQPQAASNPPSEPPAPSTPVVPPPPAAAPPQHSSPGLGAPSLWDHSGAPSTPQQHSPMPPPAPTPPPPPAWPQRPPQPPTIGQRPPASPAPGGADSYHPESVGPMRAQVREAGLVRPYKPAPQTGWRKRLHQATRINLGAGPAEREWIELKRRLSVNLRGTYLVAVLQQKGGVSKTTATVGIGAALARYRSDKVVAIDGNPASGNLAQRIDEPNTGTWRNIVDDQDLHSYSAFRHHLGIDTSSGLEVVAGDPGDEVLRGSELMTAWRKLSRQYPIGLIDCGNQLRDDITAAVLNAADAVVVVSTTRYDGATGAQDTLNWLIQHGYPHLVRSAVMVISNVNKVNATKAVRSLREEFERVVRAVHDIPYDPHLSEATAINFDRLQPDTRRAFIETAASIADGFAGAADKDHGHQGSWS